MKLQRAVQLATVIATAAALSSCLEVSAPADPGRPTPALVSGPLKFESLTAGDFHTCGLTIAGGAYCWGVNTQGQSGNGLNADQAIGTPVAVLGGFSFTSLSAGGSHTCGLRTNGSAVCWGNNVDGRIGDGTTIVRFAPATVTGGQTFTMLTTSTVGHTCGLNAAGAAYCWGGNELGQLGDGSRTSRSTPVAVGGGVAFTSITAGGWHNCGLTANGTAYCWGSGGHGALGNGTLSDRPTPVAVLGGHTFATLIAGLSHTCGLDTAGIAYCWGDNVVGALGNGTVQSSPEPVAVAGNRKFTSLVVGERHACGITGDLESMCWGYNAFGALGEGTFITRLAPVAVVSSIVFVKLAAGGYHTCGIASSGPTYCWGDNSGRQLGGDG